MKKVHQLTLMISGSRRSHSHRSPGHPLPGCPQSGCLPLVRTTPLSRRCSPFHRQCPRLTVKYSRYRSEVSDRGLLSRPPGGCSGITAVDDDGQLAT